MNRIIITEHGAFFEQVTATARVQADDLRRILCNLKSDPTKQTNKTLFKSVSLPPNTIKIQVNSNSDTRIAMLVPEGNYHIQHAEQERDAPKTKILFFPKRIFIVSLSRSPSTNTIVASNLHMCFVKDVVVTDRSHMYKGPVPHMMSKTEMCFPAALDAVTQNKHETIAAAGWDLLNRLINPVWLNHTPNTAISNAGIIFNDILEKMPNVSANTKINAIISHWEELTNEKAFTYGKALVEDLLTPILNLSNENVTLDDIL